MESRLKKPSQENFNAKAKQVVSRFNSKIGHIASKSMLDKLPKAQSSFHSNLSQTNSNHPHPTAIPSYPRIQKLSVSQSFKQKPKTLQTVRSTSQESKPSLKLNLKEILTKKVNENLKSDRNGYIKPIPKPAAHNKAMSLESSFSGQTSKRCKTSREFLDTLKEDKENFDENSSRSVLSIISKEKLLKSPNIQALCKNSFEMSLDDLEAKLTCFYKSLPQ
ncbi:unnamed protein product [Blepharisma stoltei]|uniref:Exophilin 5 n=1 Tax=Blepharisma stoltei TaxID=1481888 RepID=A0AAU9IRE4_9CILI|nr:unnamed protein product [Blepharisma stoltei]